MSGADEKIRAVLERVGREMTEQIRVHGSVFIDGAGLESWNPPSPGKVASLSAELLERRLLPLLLAGQAMRDCNYINERNSMAWDAALAAAQGQPEKESGR